MVWSDFPQTHSGQCKGRHYVKSRSYRIDRERGVPERTELKWRIKRQNCVRTYRAYAL